MISRRPHHKLFGALLLASFTLVILVTGFHHHKDVHFHADCAFCVAAHHPTVASHQSSFLMLSICLENGWRSQPPSFVPLRDSAPTVVRGPPLSEAG